MRELVNACRVDPGVIQTAVGIIYLTPERADLAEVNALFCWVRDHVRYVRDVVGVETLCDPRMTLQRMVGDCDDQVTLLCSLLESVGYPTRFVMAGYNGPDFEHVYCQVLVNGQWLDCDPTEREPIGWAPPAPVAYYIEGVSL
jgi:transglutaminase-like putative cysteine protease